MAFLVLLGLLAFASAEDMNSALNTDNECFGDGACAFNALQVHAMQSFDEQLIEVSRDGQHQCVFVYVHKCANACMCACM